MVPLRRKIEDRSITALQSIIDDHPTMEGYINKRDKEPSWDGYIRLYQNDNFVDEKANYDDDVPVQIKGHVDKNRKYMDKERITSPVDLKDLTVYYRKFGCLYFVMYMNEEGSDVKIFYSSLYPSKIKGILEEAERRKNKGSISIPFLKLEKDCKVLYLLCKQFSFEIRKQGSGIGQIVPRAITANNLEHVKKITATTIGGATPYDLLRKINTGDTVFYGSIDESGIQYPMQIHQMIASVKQVFNVPVFIGDKQYYSSFEMETTVTGPDVKNYIREGTHIVRPSQNIELTLKKPTINFKFQFVTDLMQLKRDAEFVLDLIDKLEITVFNEKIPMGNLKVDKGFVEQLHDIIEAGTVLGEIGCNILIPFKELTDNDRAQIDFLCNIRNGKIHFNTDKKVFLYEWTFRNKSWPIVVDYREDRVKFCGYMFNMSICFSLGNPDGEEYPEKLPENAYIVPNFLHFEPDLLANLYFYDFESMYEQIDRSVFNEHTVDELNGLALNLITAYDLNGNEKLLDISNELLRRISETYPDVVHYVVNMCQIEVRKTGKLSQKSVAKLDSFLPTVKTLPKPENESQADIERVFMYCVAVLKGDVEDAGKLYSQLSEADKKGVEDWPIRTLHLKMEKH